MNYNFIGNITTSAKTGENIEEAFQMLINNIYKHNLKSVTNFIGWTDDDTKNNISISASCQNLQSFYESGSFKLNRNSHIVLYDNESSGKGKPKKKCN